MSNYSLHALIKRGLIVLLLYGLSLLFFEPGKKLFLDHNNNFLGGTGFVLAGLGIMFYFLGLSVKLGDFKLS